MISMVPGHIKRQPSNMSAQGIARRKDHRPWPVTIENIRINSAGNYVITIHDSRHSEWTPVVYTLVGKLLQPEGYIVAFGLDSRGRVFSVTCVPAA
jgi:hypothetical protein